MRRVRVLHLTSRSLTVQRWQGACLREAFEFDADAQGLHSFSRYLAAEPREPALLLVDVVEEEFTVEAVPHALGRARRQLHARRCERLFGATPLRTAVPLGRAREGRRDDRILFSALSRPEATLLWLDKVVAAGVPLRAVSSVPHVSAALPRALGLERESLLLVSDHGGRLRHTFFRGGELRTSRLCHADPDPAAMLEEIVRTRRYLQSGGLHDRGADLHVCVLADEPLLAKLARIPLADGIRLRLGALHEAASALGLCSSETLGAPALVAGLFVQRPRNRYAQASHRRGWQAHRARLAVEGCGLVIGLVLCLAGIMAAVGALQALGTSAALRTELAGLSPMAGLPESLPDNLSPHELATSVERAEQIARLQLSPEKALARIGEALQFHPELELRRIAWAASTDPGMRDLSVVERTSALVPEVAATAGGRETRVYHHLVIEGRVVEPGGDLQRALDTAERAVARLKGMPDVAEATLLSRPVDPDGALQGNAGRDDEGTTNFPLTLRVVLRP